MRDELSRKRVDGFLHARDGQILNGRDEPVQLVGWGLGNWLLCEGYMWLLGDFAGFDRPRRIEARIAELAGEEYAETFWIKFRDRYIAAKDLEEMAELGYNSLRVPINSRLFLEDGEEIRFREEGFRRLDWLLGECEKQKLYVWIDLHGAPGGQTGANIDDSEDDLCHLFMEEAQFHRGVALWEEIARRYGNRWIVAGYDLLNEPIRPVRQEGDPDLDGYEPRLREFYEQAIQAIRTHDSKHLIALEGKHWATDLAIFDHVYDGQMVLHFHRYGCAPELEAYEAFLTAAERLKVPLWLGETGESYPAWFGGMMPLALRLGIHVSLWPWKKMRTENSPCSVEPPEGWEKIRTWLEGGAKPEPAEARKILDAMLERIRFEQCTPYPELTALIFRMPGCEIQGTDFDESLRGEETCHAVGVHEPGVYRKRSGMEVRANPETEIPAAGFDGPWRGAELILHEGEWVRYSFYEVTSSCEAEIATRTDTPARIEVYQGQQLLGGFDLSACRSNQILSGLRMYTEDACTLRVLVIRGTVRIQRLRIHPVPAL